MQAREALAPGAKNWAGRNAAADGQRLDAVAAAVLAQATLAAPPTRQRRAILRLCLDTLRDSKALGAETLASPYLPLQSYAPADSADNPHHRLW